MLLVVAQEAGELGVGRVPGGKRSVHVEVGISVRGLHVRDDRVVELRRCGVVQPAKGFDADRRALERDLRGNATVAFVEVEPVEPPQRLGPQTNDV